MFFQKKLSKTFDDNKGKLSDKWYSYNATPIIKSGNEDSEYMKKYLIELYV